MKEKDLYFFWIALARQLLALVSDPVMKQAAFRLLFAVVALGASAAWGQAFRSAGSAQSAGSAAPGSASSGSFQRAPMALRAPSRFEFDDRSHQFRSEGDGVQIIIRSAPTGTSAGQGALFRSRESRGPSGGQKPGHPIFPKHKGILIIDVPSVIETTVTTRTDHPARNGPPAKGEQTRPAQDAQLRKTPKHLAPFDPTPGEVVERMLALGGVKKGDVVYDLGSGDGRIVIGAAKKYGARAVGFEIDAGLVKLARENVRKAGLEGLVEIRQQDFMTADLSPATVVTLYLSFDGNLKVRPLLMRQLKPGTRVVSYQFDMGDWQPKIAETYRDSAGETHLLYYWEISGPFASAGSSK